MNQLTSTECSKRRLDETYVSQFDGSLIDAYIFRYPIICLSIYINSLTNY